MLDQHSQTKSILLHLYPGVVTILLYLLLSSLSTLELPNILLLLIAATISITFTQLGFLLWQAKQKQGSYNFFKLFIYNNKLQLAKYVKLTALYVFLAFLLLTLLSPLEAIIYEQLFSWFPDLAWPMLDDYSRNIVYMTFAYGFLFNGLILPTIEEFYFRGYLLPRMEAFGKRAALVNTILFSVYHFWTPWQLLSRIVALYPWINKVQQLSNLKLGIIIHCILNTLGMLLALGMIAG